MGAKLSRRAVIATSTAFAAAPKVPPAAAHRRPNIVWIICHDVHAPLIGCYGNALARTPAIDGLARDGTLYKNAFSTTPVCAPSRFALVTGAYAQSCAPAQQHRAVASLPEALTPLPLHLRAAGYYCTNNVMTDYNMDADPAVMWNDSSITAHWRNRPANTPFFAVYNYLITHESHLFANSPTETDPATVSVPPYLPDLPEVRQALARNIDMVNKQDVAVAHLLGELASDGLADETFVFFSADHGGAHPRSKRYCYDDGLHVPLIVRVPSNFAHLSRHRPGQSSDEIVSLVDFAPTALALAGLNMPKTMAGRAFLGAHTGPERHYAFSMRDRMDERYDLVQTVRDGRYRYIRNYTPQRIYGEHEAYQWQCTAYQAWERAHLAGQLDENQARFWQPKPAEELYDTVADPHSLLNLVAEPRHAERIATLRAALDAHMLSIVDGSFVPEGAAPEGYAASRQPGAYPLKTLIRLAGRAIARDRNNIPHFIDGLADQNDAVRFWCVQGLILAEPMPPHAVAAVEDRLAVEKIDQIRCALAEALATAGKVELARDTLAAILRPDGDKRAQLRALNVMSVLTPEQLRPIRPLIASESLLHDEYLHEASKYLLLRIEGTYKPNARIFAMLMNFKIDPKKPIGDPRI